MTPRRHRCLGFTLVELLIALMIGGLLFTLVGAAMLDALYLQHVAVEHGNRGDTTASLVHTVRADALGAARYAWREGGPANVLELVRTGADGQTGVRYDFEGERVTRFVEGREHDRWEAPRLRFDARLAAGPARDTLWVSLIETPAARARNRSDRVLPVAVLLPPAEATDGGRTW